MAACPANLFVPTADGGILFNYEQCFECGTCYLVCNTEGAITWTLPRGRPRRRLPAELAVRFGVCLKLQDRRPEVDPLTGAARHDPRFTGLSDADLAALEWALRCADAWGGTVVAVTAGPAVADGILHFALGDGAEARRVNLTHDAPSETVAAALAPALAGCELVWCGDQSLDRGSGSVPAYLAALLGARQALGLVAIELDGTPGVVTATRRLDGGRRERLRVRAPGVLSVEGATARLRRASVGSWLAARRSAIDVQPGPPVIEQGSRTTRPFRPRARVLPAPVGHTARRADRGADRHRPAGSSGDHGRDAGARRGRGPHPGGAGRVGVPGRVRLADATWPDVDEPGLLLADPGRGVRAARSPPRATPWINAAYCSIE